MSKKVKTSLVIGSAAILLLAIILVVVNNYSNSENHTDDNITIVGTWYSDKPDSVTFTEDGTYSFAAWNGGNPWLTFDGTYTVEDSTVTMQNQLDGENCLTISKAEDGGVILTGRYTYYQTEEAAKAAISITEEKATEDAANIIPNTVNELLGEWTSLDGTVTCTFTEKSFIVYFKGNDVVPEETLYREYEILSDKQIKIYKNGVANIYNYSLTEQDGEPTLWCTAIEYAPTYKKTGGDVMTENGVSDTAGNEGTVVTIDRVISSEKNPDMSAYTAELSAFVNETLIGTWQGTFDEWPNKNTVYWSYTFTKGGTYTFTDGSINEAGTYTVVSDPNNNYYHSTMTLTSGNEARKVQFYFSMTDPVKMITDDNTDPTFFKVEG